MGEHHRCFLIETVKRNICFLQAWQRPTLPCLKTKYHRRWEFSRPSSEWDRVQASRHSHQAGKKQKLFIVCPSVAGRRHPPAWLSSHKLGRPVGLTRSCASGTGTTNNNEYILYRVCVSCDLAGFRSGRDRVPGGCPKA
jgi:hypothetical protein